MKISILRLIIDLIGLPISVIIMALKGASLNQIYINLGSRLLRTGAVVQVGQPWVTPQPQGRPSKKQWVKNVIFNFGSNKIVATYSPKPIPGVSEKFYKNKQ